MVYYFFSFMITVVEVWCVLYFLDTFLKKKAGGALGSVRFVLYFGAVFLPAYICHLFEVVWNGGKILSVFCGVLILGLFFYEASIKQLFLYWTLCYGMMVLTEWLAISIGGVFITSIDLYSEEQTYLLGTVAKLMEILVVLTIRKIWKSPNESRSLNPREWRMLVCLPMFSIACVMLMFCFYDNEAAIGSVYLFLTFGLVIINFIAIYLLQDILDKSEQLRVSTLANQNAKNQIEAYHDMDAVYERQRKKMHDYKNQIVTVQNLVQSGNIEKAVSLMSQLTESISVDMSAINTNHPVVNAVVNQKFHTAKEKQISMIFQIGDVHEIQLTEEESVILLCNLLDNAITECEKVVKEGRDAVIKFKLVYEDGRMILSVKNPVSHKVKITDNKVQADSKKGHGIGLKNVETVVEKYDGSIVFDCDDKEFRAVVIL